MFYSIEEKKNDGVLMNVTVRLDAEDPIYLGHFPGHPITPGAMLVKMAIDLIGEQRGDDVDAQCIKNVKFIHPHHPQKNETLTFSFDATKNPVDVVVSAEGLVFAKMTLVY